MSRLLRARVIGHIAFVLVWAYIIFAAIETGENPTIADYIMLPLLGLASMVFIVFVYKMSPSRAEEST